MQTSICVAERLDATVLRLAGGVGGSARAHARLLQGRAVAGWQVPHHRLVCSLTHSLPTSHFPLPTSHFPLPTLTFSYFMWICHVLCEMITSLEFSSLLLLFLCFLKYTFWWISNHFWQFSKFRWTHLNWARSWGPLKSLTSL